MHKERTVLYYFTESYPYGNGEQFLYVELLELSKRYDEIVVFPLRKLNQKRPVELPQNVEIIEPPGAFETRKVWFLKNLRLLFHVFLSEIKRKRGYLQITRIKTFCVEIARASWLAEFISLRQPNLETQPKISYYTNWMNDWALALAVLSYRNDQKLFAVKMRGFDLFDYRNKLNFIPYRDFIFANAKTRMTVSTEGVEYLKKMGYNNVFLNYTGIRINRLFYAPNAEEFVLVSCSNILPIKRVDMIAEAVKKSTFRIKWIHFGTGPDLELVKGTLTSLPKNVSVELRGHVSNEALLYFYSNNHVDAFVHVSSTEGFGFAIVEALISGIPAILYPVGGVKEIMDERYSIILPQDLNNNILSDAIASARNYFPQSIDFRREIQAFYAEKFNLERQGKELYDLIEKPNT